MLRVIYNKKEIQAIVSLFCLEDDNNIITKNYVILFFCLFFLFLYLWHFVFVEYLVTGEGEGEED